MAISYDEKRVMYDADPVQDNYVRQPRHRLRVQAVPEGESKTLQSEAEAADINNIISRFDRDGFLPAATRTPQYDDVSELNGDLGELINKSVQALTEFDSAVNDLQKQKEAEAAAAASNVKPPPVGDSQQK